MDHARHGKLSTATHEVVVAAASSSKNIAEPPPEQPRPTASLDAVSEARLIGAARAGDDAARAELLEALAPEIRSMARRYRTTAAGDRELVEAGTGGLLRALERYDAEQGTPFWPYASWWVRHAMRSLASPPEA
jgi:DNA-directed RNA polymerase sigma subunit (sigma70/sigma32)